MPSLNKVMLMGNLTRDPETRTIPNGSVTELGLAINRTWKDAGGNKQEETTFVDATYFGKIGEVIAQYVKKGQPIYIEGRLKLETWRDKESGQNRSKLKVIGEGFEFLSSKSDSSGQSPTTRDNRHEAQPDADDDIPF